MTSATSSTYFTKRDHMETTAKRLFNQDFGTPLNANDLFNSHIYRRWPSKSFGPNASIFDDKQSGFSYVKNEPTMYQIMLDCNQFQPEQLNVKTVENLLIINAKHEEKEDEHGWIEREFTRKYKLPDDVDFENVISFYRSDGVLTVNAPKKVIRSPSKIERIIPVSISESRNHYERQTSSCSNKVDTATDP